MPESKPPTAKRIPHQRTVHGDTVVDDWYWLLDRDDPDTIAYLEAENAYTEAQTERLAPLRERLFDEIKARVQETDLSVPAQRGPWWYLTRTEEGRQYPIVCRRPGPDDEAGEQVLLDGNTLAGDSPYFALGVVDVSPDHSVLAYSTDHDGDERYVLRFKDLSRGELLADEIPGTYYGSAWAADNRRLFYVTVDDASRPYRLWRHELGTHADDDVLVFEEDDERFHLSVGLTRSLQLVVLTLESKITTEQRVLDAHEPEGAFEVIEPRRQGVEYSIDHQGDRFVIVSNATHRDFALYAAPASTPTRAQWRELWAPGEGTRISDVDAFADHLVVHYRKDAATHLRVIPNDGDPYDIAFDEEVRSVEPDANHEYATSMFRLSYESLVTPPSVYDFDLGTRELVLRKQQPVLGGFDPTSYVSAREWATAPDGARVPISIVHRRDVPHDGTAPMLLYGYGSYEIAIDPYFSAIRLPLLDRGIVFAIAHIRGGGEMGRAWYEHGKLLEKPNTFTDFVACAEHLCAVGYTSPNRLAARGGSAGGLLMGAVANLAPALFRAIVAEVPFVDALNTILDPTLPLTVTEWEEWGNPIESEEVYRCMKGYSPYENVQAISYPAILATAGLNDPRVGYHEPAKWVAKLRSTARNDRTLLLKTEMGMGHSGPSGRYDSWREQAFVGAFLIDELGAPTEPVYTDSRE
jgi:oligopeptidase B